MNLVFYFGDRPVGTLSLEGADGIGTTFFENGVEAFDDTGRVEKESGATFIDAVERAVNDEVGLGDLPYFHVERKV